MTTVDTERPQGTQRDDDLLSLDERAVPHRLALLSLTRTLITTTLVGHPAPVVAEIRDRMRNPVSGDFVVEWTTATSEHAPLDDRIKGIGYLIERRRESYGGPDPDDIGHEGVWYVQYGPAPGDVCRWVNADFVAIPIADERWWRL